MKKRLITLAVLAITLTGTLTGCSSDKLYENDKVILSDANAFMISDCSEEINGQSMKASISKVKGMNEIWTYEADKDMTLDVSYLLKATKGEAKLVLITPDKTVTNIVEATSESKMDGTVPGVLELKKGHNVIKFVAKKDTAAEFEINIPVGEFKKMEMEVDVDK